MKVTLSASLFLLALTSLTFSQPPNLYTFGPDVEITEAPPNDGTSIGFFSSGQHYTAFRGDTVYAVWAESRATTSPTGNHVFFAKSIDIGQTFGPNVRVNSTAAGFNPSMRVDTNGIVYVAYERQGNIFFTRSTDGGNTFSSAIQVVDSIGLPYFQELPSIAVNDRGHVFIAWRDDRTDPGQSTKAVFATASYDGGLTFTPSVQVNEMGTVGRYFDIAANRNGYVYVAYQGSTGGANGIVVARSTDSGESYTNYVLASDLPPGSGQIAVVDPSLAISPEGLIGVAWRDFRNDEFTLRFSRSVDQGLSFSSSIIVDTSGFPQLPSLVWNRNVFWVSWRENQFDTAAGEYVDHISFSYSSNEGQAFSKVASVFNNNFVIVNNPSVSVNENGYAFISWLDDRYDPSFMERWHLFGAIGSAHIVKGDLNLDSLLTPTDVVMELNAVFLNQSFPAPFEAADGNCDSLLSPADVVLHLRATFNGEPFPC